MRLEKVYTGEGAAEYEADRAQTSVWRREQQVIGDVLRLHLKPGDRVVDIAAGTGRWLEIYAERQVTATLLDVSDDMLRIAEQKAVHLGIEIAVRQTDVLDRPQLPDGDWAVATRFFNWIDLSDVTRCLQAAVNAGISGIVFSVVLRDSRAPPILRLWATARILLKNFKVRAGVRDKSHYYLHTDTDLMAMLKDLNARVIDELIVARQRGAVYKVFVATRGIVA
jgi:SAM-dependent methyltransferase